MFISPKNLFELSGFRVTWVLVNLIKSHGTKESVRVIRFSSYRGSSYPGSTVFFFRNINCDIKMEKMKRTIFYRLQYFTSTFMNFIVLLNEYPGHTQEVPRKVPREVPRRYPGRSSMCNNLIHNELEK